MKDKLPAIAGFYPLDVASDARKEFFDAFSKDNPNLKADIMIHAIGFAPRDKCFDETKFSLSMMRASILRIQFLQNSLQRCLKFALPYLNPGSSTITALRRERRGTFAYGIMSMAKAH